MSRFPTPASKPADEQAADWAARLDGGALSPEDAAALKAWLDSDGDNEGLLAEFQVLHGRIGATMPGLARDKVLLPFPAQERPAAWPRAWTAGLAAAAVVTLVSMWWIRRPEVIETHASERREVTLVDGSRAGISADTLLSVSLRGSVRRVELSRGEAYFEVAKDASRPFFVTTPAGTVQVTGTQFNVRTDGPDRLEVTVLDGSVAVKGGGEAAPHLLKPRDQLSYEAGQLAVRQLSSEGAGDTVAWREGFVVFDDATLQAAARRFARYLGREIEISPSVASLRLGGRFKLDDLDGFLLDVQSSLPVRVERGNDGFVRLVSR